MSEPKLNQVQVIVQFARENEDGDIEHFYDPVVFQVTPAEWKKGWDWRADFAVTIEKLLSEKSEP